MLHNPGADYMRGFELLYGKRPAARARRTLPSIDPDDAQYPDGRIAPVSRLAKQFLRRDRKRRHPTPGFAEGYRVQQLIDAARRSHRQGACDRSRRRSGRRGAVGVSGAASSSPAAAASSAPAW